MKKSTEYNLELIESIEGIDQINKEFYGKYNYPWEPSMLRSFTDTGFWPAMLNQDLGYWHSERIPEDARIWVAGCGTNQAAITAMKYPNAQIIGTDISTRSLEACQRKIDQLKLGNIQLIEQSLNEPIFEEEFDVVICTGVIHHNAQPWIPLSTLVKGLKKNGVMELMVYNYYHRILTTAYQKAIRKFCKQDDQLSFEAEFSITRKLIDDFPVDNILGQLLKSKRGQPDAEIADALLQPVEYSYTMESLNDLVTEQNLEILQPCVNQFDKNVDSFDWGMDFKDREINKAYHQLSDVDRWQVSNLLMVNQSPMLWLYLQKQDSDFTRITERDLCKEFLETRFDNAKTPSLIYMLNAEGKYELTSERHSYFPFEPSEPHLKQILEHLDPQLPIKETLRKLNIDFSFNTVNKIRTRMATTGFPYLRSVKA